MVIEIGNAEFGTNPVTHDSLAFVLFGSENRYCGWEYLFSDEIRDGANVYRGWNRGITKKPGFYKAGVLAFKCAADLGTETVFFDRAVYDGNSGGYILYENAKNGTGRQFVVGSIANGTDVYLVKDDGTQHKRGRLSVRIYATLRNEGQLVKDEVFVGTVSIDVLRELFSRKIHEEYRLYSASVELLKDTSTIISLAPVLTGLQNIVSWSESEDIPRNTLRDLICADDALFKIREAAKGVGNACSFSDINASLGKIPKAERPSPAPKEDNPDDQAVIDNETVPIIEVPKDEPARDKEKPKAQRPEKKPQYKARDDENDWANRVPTEFGDEDLEI